MPLDDVKLIKLFNVKDERGDLTVLENENSLPFKFKRIFYSYNIQEGKSRGGHAHKNCKQLMIALNGSFKVFLDDGRNNKTLTLNNPDIGLYIPERIWVKQSEFSKNAICLVLASDEYDENEYIRNYSALIEMIK